LSHKWLLLYFIIKELFQWIKLYKFNIEALELRWLHWCWCKYRYWLIFNLRKVGMVDGFLNWWIGLGWCWVWLLLCVLIQWLRLKEILNEMDLFDINNGLFDLCFVIIFLFRKCILFSFLPFHSFLFCESSLPLFRK